MLQFLQNAESASDRSSVRATHLIELPLDLLQLLRIQVGQLDLLFLRHGWLA